MYQVTLFLHCMGAEALEFFNGMSFDNAQEREKLESIVNAYVARLRTLSQTCNFCECIRELLIHDRIVLGIQNPQTRERVHHK